MMYRLEPNMALGDQQQAGPPHVARPTPAAYGPCVGASVTWGGTPSLRAQILYKRRESVDPDGRCWAPRPTPAMLATHP